MERKELTFKHVEKGQGIIQSNLLPGVVDRSFFLFSVFEPRLVSFSLPGVDFDLPDENPVERPLERCAENSRRLDCLECARL